MSRTRYLSCAAFLAFLALAAPACHWVLAGPSREAGQTVGFTSEQAEDGELEDGEKDGGKSLEVVLLHSSIRLSTSREIHFLADEAGSPATRGCLVWGTRGPPLA
jgi:hypothetical protein